MTGKVFIHATLSYDGFIADPDGTIDWIHGYSGLPAEAFTEIVNSIGAALGGRRGHDRAAARGQRPYGGAWHGPLFVLTHRPADPPSPGPDVTFLSGGVREAVATARAAAGGKDVVVMGADVGRQCLREGLVDEILVHQVPLVLGEGIRLFEDTGRIELAPVAVTHSGDLTTLRHRVVRP